MIMKQTSITLATAVLLLSGSCSKTEDINAVSNEIRFSAEYPSVTRATATSFESGDMMGVYVTKYDGNMPQLLQVSGNYVNNSQAVYNGSTWSCTPAIYWEDGKFDIYAYYPYDKPVSVDNYAFTVALDQSVPETTDALNGYEASDFLWAKAESVSRMDVVPLTFHHRMSRFVIRLQKGEDYEGDIPSDAVVRIHNTVPMADIDLATGIVTKNAYGSTHSITARKDDAGVYSAILVPQRIDTHRPLVEVLAKGVSYLVESSFVFKTGTQHTMTITLNNDPDRVKIEVGGEILGWN